MDLDVDPTPPTTTTAVNTTASNTMDNSTTAMDIDVKPQQEPTPLPQPVPVPVPIAAPQPMTDSNNPAPQAPLLVAAAEESSAPAPVAPLPSLSLLPSRPSTPSGDPVSADPGDTAYHSPTASEYEPDENSPPPRPPIRSKTTPKTPKTPKNKINRVATGRVEKSSSPGGSSSVGTTTLKCPVRGCGQTFTGRNPRQSLWHHLKYYATRGLPDKEDFEKAHGEAHSLMKEEAEPKGTPVERNRISSSDYRKKNPERAKTSARLSNFRARARKKGLTNEKEIEEKVNMWEKEWQEKQAKEASEYFSGILLSAFE
ncbi:uncharacterized protein H6S33_004579 [Morchella sextelata]|uniref:uncharacterized protein n=1 Tax=Morchella sextelata TaxID=1174677 RepID=UPI001D03EF3B|nr:uncharacterized protein H6S33_004579 [Morchella sextelata]KAH0605357.1 hypothetical protein H6S33_004579 [Morchella sextelata]